MPITPSLRHCSNKYKLAREGEKDKEKYEDLEKGKFIIIFFFLMKSSCVSSERDEFSVVAWRLTEIQHSGWGWEVGLCDMDKKYISRFFDFFFDFDFNHDFDKQTCFISHLTCFCTSYLFLHILLVLHILFCTFLYSITHFTLLFLPIYIYICSCVVLLLYNFYSLHCPLSGPDLIYISLLIIPCIIYHVTNKETLTFTVINAFCVNLKHISKGNQLDLSQKVVTCL